MIPMTIDSPSPFIPLEGHQDPLSPSPALMSSFQPLCVSPSPRRYEGRPAFLDFEYQDFECMQPPLPPPALPPLYHPAAEVDQNLDHHLASQIPYSNPFFLPQPLYNDYDPALAHLLPATIAPAALRPRHMTPSGYVTPPAPAPAVASDTADETDTDTVMSSQHPSPTISQLSWTQSDTTRSAFAAFIAALTNVAAERDQVANDDKGTQVDALVHPEPSPVNHTLQHTLVSQDQVQVPSEEDSFILGFWADTHECDNNTSTATALDTMPPSPESPPQSPLSPLSEETSPWSTNSSTSPPPGSLPALGESSATSPSHEPVTPVSALTAPSPAETSSSSSTRTRRTVQKRTFKDALWDAINDDSFSQWIHWSDDGTCGVIPDKKKFEKSKAMRAITDARDVGGFVRQLNMWGFQRSKDPEGGTHSCLFTHELFQQDRYDLFVQLTRKEERKNRPTAGRRHRPAKVRARTKKSRGEEGKPKIVLSARATGSRKSARNHAVQKSYKETEDEEDKPIAGPSSKAARPQAVSKSARVKSQKAPPKTPKTAAKRPAESIHEDEDPLTPPLRHNGPYYVSASQKNRHKEPARPAARHAGVEIDGITIPNVSPAILNSSSLGLLYDVINIKRGTDALKQPPPPQEPPAGNKRNYWLTDPSSHLDTVPEGPGSPPMSYTRSVVVSSPSPRKRARV